MTIPDLAAFRALVEVASLRRNTQLRPPEEFAVPDDWIVVPRADFDAVRAALPAAQETLEQVETELLGLQGAYTMAADDNGNLRARLAQLEEALARYGKHRANCGPATPTTDLQSLCTCRLDAVLEGRDE